MLELASLGIATPSASPLAATGACGEAASGELAETLTSLCLVVRKEMFTAHDDVFLPLYGIG